MNLTIFSSNTTNNAKNCSYPHEHTITGIDTARIALSTDYVCARYKNNYRNINNFIATNCLPFDIDNDHTDVPDEWITPKMVAEFFTDVPFLVHYSRNHMKEKGGKEARPKFHILFQTSEITNADECRRLKELVYSIYPYVDKNALDAGRFFFGTENPQVEIYEGNTLLSDFLWNKDIDLDFSQPVMETIPKGTRNATLSKYAGKIIKRYGDTDIAFQEFMKKADACVPPLSTQELHTIWRSAQSFFKKVSQSSDYIPPQDYNSELSLEPDDFTDVGQATLLKREYQHILRYSEATNFLVFTGKMWEESNPHAQGLAQRLTLRQLIEAERRVKDARERLVNTGAETILATTSANKAQDIFNNEQTEAYQEYQAAKAYLSFVMKRRESKNITSTLREVRPMLLINPNELDANPFLLNTPNATYDLRLGMLGGAKHNQDDFITKITSVSPSDEGEELWQETLNTTFSGNTELIDYVQRIVGVAAIGKVYHEAIVIAYGDGRNGKSTFWNLISRVLGTYSGAISADTLTVGCKRNVKPELAETKGKRLLIAAELEEGQRLNTSTVKQLASTDDIYAEKKYKAPFKFQPSHTLVLYTNHLPKVGATDDGIWRRLIVIPFKAKIEGTKDIKNYADYLFKHCGGACLKWIIEGAEMIIREKYILNPPKCVQEAMDTYKENNHWLNHFLDDCCNKAPADKAPSGELYKTYRDYCLSNGEYARSTTDFYTALDLAGFRRHKTNKGSFVYGISIKPLPFDELFVDD